MDEKTTAEALGLAYHSIPVANRDALNWETAQQVHALLENATGTALVHCRSGNRVGAVFALDAAKSQGASLEEALEIGRAHGMTSLEEHIRPLLEAGTPP